MKRLLHLCSYIVGVFFAQALVSGTVTCHKTLQETVRRVNKCHRHSRMALK